MLLLLGDELLKLSIVEATVFSGVVCRRKHGFRIRRATRRQMQTTITMISFMRYYAD